MFVLPVRPLPSNGLGHWPQTNSNNS